MTHKKVKYKSGNLPFSIYSSSVDAGYVAEMALLESTIPEIPSGTSEQELTASDGETGDSFGQSVSIVSGSDGIYALCGAPGDDDQGSAAGAAYIYHSTSAGITEQKLTASNGAINDYFGRAVSIASGSDGIYALCGAYGDDDRGSIAGAAYIYHSTSAGITEQKLTASDGAINDYFGQSVSIASGSDGIYALCGAYGDDDQGTTAGAAYTYHSTSAGITEQKLTASDGEASDYFGFSVSIASGPDGIYALCGAYADDDQGSLAGAAYIYHSTSVGITEQKLTASDGEAGDAFGYSVSIASGSDGIYSLFGAYAQDEAAYRAGAAYIYHSTSAGVLTEQKLTASDAEASDYFGFSVSIASGAYGIYALASAYAESEVAATAGAAYIYHSTSAGVLTEQKLTASDGMLDDRLGWSVSIASGTFGTFSFAGAYQHDAPSDNEGAAYIFHSYPSVPTKYIFSDPNFDITNLHEDTYGDIKGAPLQGPFTYQYVGGNQHRHIPINDGTDTWWSRPELFRINFTSSNDIKVIGQGDSSLVDMTPKTTAATGITKIAWIAIDSDAGKLYYARYDSSGGIYRWDIASGSTPETIVSPVAVPRDLALDIGSNKVYWTSDSNNNVQRADMSVSSSAETIAEGLTAPYGIALDTAAGKVYWADSGTGMIQRANMSVSASVETVISGLTNPYDIALDVAGGKIYWTDKTDDNIKRANMSDGSSVEIIIPDVGLSPEYLALDVSRNMIYYTDDNQNDLWRAPMNGVSSPGSDPIKLVDGTVDGSTALDIAAGHAYWSDDGKFGATFYRVDMNPYLPLVSYTRDGTAKRPVNIANHQTYNPLGNYTYDYEIIQTVGRTSNNRAFVEATTGAYAAGFIGDPTLPYSGSMITQFVSGARDPLTGTALPVFGSDETVFVNRFSAPGGTEVSSRGALDTYAEEYAPNNEINIRNRSVRSVLRSDLAKHTPDPDLASLSGSTKYHTDYRNPKLDFAEPSASLSAREYYPPHVSCNPRYDDLIYQAFNNILIEPTSDLDNDELGFAVSVTSGSDGVYAVAGAPGDTVSAATTNGAVVLYRYVASMACNQKTLLEFSHISQTVITASDGRAGDNFGYATAVTSGSDGVYILVGARHASRTVATDPLMGKAYLYHSRSSGFEIPRDEQILTASNWATGDKFGWSVSLVSASNGIHAMVGSPLADIGGVSAAGRAYIYHSTSAGFDIPRDEAKFHASAYSENAAFGAAVSLWGRDYTSNMYALVGAPQDTVSTNGKAYLYQSHVETFGDVTTFSNTGVLDDDMTSVDTHIDCADDATATNREGDYCCSFASGSGVRLLQWDNMFGIGNLTVELKVLKGIDGANGPCPYLSNGPESGDDLRIQYSTDGAAWSDFTTNGEIDRLSFDYDNWLPHTASVDLAVPAYVRVAQPSHSLNANDQWAIQNLRITSEDGWEIPSGWEQVLTASDGAPEDQFGYSVSVAVGAWGIYSLVGAPEHGDSYNEGQAYLYHSQSAVANVPEVVITSPYTPSIAANFGHSCAIISAPPSLHQRLRFVIGQYSNSFDPGAFEYDAPNESLNPFADTSLFGRRWLFPDPSTTRLGKAVSIVSGSVIEDTIKFLGAPRSAAASTAGDCVLYISSSEQKSYTVYSSSYDNAYVTHAIPRASLDYSWINASAITTKTQLPGYQNSSSY